MEEFDRFLDAWSEILPKEYEKIAGQFTSGWKRFSKALLYSGLRLEELFNMHWTREDRIHVANLDSFSDPVIVIPGQCQKNKQSLEAPCSMEFADLLRETPVDEREGRVFSPCGFRGRPVIAVDYAGELIIRAGRKAGIIVHHYENGKKKFASAHDLRRTFATRWANAGFSEIELMLIMRHESIETTKQFYLTQRAYLLSAKMRTVTEEGAK